MTLSKQEKRMLAIMVIVVVIAVGLVSTGGSKSGGSKKLLPLAEAQTQLVKAAQQLKQMNADQLAMQPRVQMSTYDDQADLVAPKVVRNLEKIADKADVHLEEIKPGKAAPVKGASAMRVPLEVRIHAAFQPNIVKFLYYVEAPTEKLTVDKLDITSTDARLKTVDVTAQISVYTHSSSGANASQTGDVSYVFTTKRNG